MPSGEFFIKEMSISREYAFWCALLADLEKDVVGKKFSLENTYEPDFKLDVVMRLFQDVLIPSLRMEIEHIENYLVVPKHYDYSHLHYFLTYFTFNRSSYIRRLLSSVHLTVEYSGLVYEERVPYHREFSTISDRVAGIEREYRERACKKD